MESISHMGQGIGVDSRIPMTTKVSKLTGVIPIFAIMICASSCTTAKPEFVVLKYTWKYCWEACGKKDNLAAVSSTECICSQGDPIPLQPSAKTQKASGGFMNDFLKFLNGE